MTTIGITAIGTDLRETTTRRTGPNNTRRVIWAISKLLLLLPEFFLHILIVYLLFIDIIDIKRLLKL